MVPANVPAKSPGKMTAQFKSMTLNSSSKGIPVRDWVVMYYSVSNNPPAASVLCLSTGIYHIRAAATELYITSKWRTGIH